MEPYLSVRGYRSTFSCLIRCFPAPFLFLLLLPDPPVMNLPSQGSKQDDSLHSKDDHQVDSPLYISGIDASPGVKRIAAIAEGVTPGLRIFLFFGESVRQKGRRERADGSPARRCLPRRVVRSFLLV